MGSDTVCRRYAARSALLLPMKYHAMVGLGKAMAMASPEMEHQ